MCPGKALGSIKSIRRRVSLLERTGHPPVDSSRDNRSTRTHEEPALTTSPSHPSMETSHTTDNQNPNLVSLQGFHGDTNGAGTLVVNSDGRSKFIGQSASYQWLRDVREPINPSFRH